MNAASSPAVRAVVVGLCLSGASVADAGEPWITPGNVQVRHDIQFLVDTGAIDLPVTHWPIAASDLGNALSNMAKGARDGREWTPAQRAAASRLRAHATEGRPSLGFELDGAAKPMQMRTFQDVPREDAQVTAQAAGFLGERYGARLEITAVTDASDDETVRLDGSYAAAKFGNWIVTAGAQDRWWGSGWEGSLILSTNARPVPALAIDRAVSLPFESRWLSWIGPWRLTTFMGRMEGDRGDYDHPLLWGMRISARPLDGLEISVDRTAQWCGKGRSCSLDDFWNVVSGNDNAGENVDPADEPGNQLASYEIRWALPLGPWDYAVYFQHTGESIDNRIPRPYRSLDLLGIETWHGTGTDGSSWRTGVEWAQTRCGGTVDGQKVWDCAYNNGIFTDGYRYYGRPLGHSMDGDGQMYSARFVRVDPAASTLSVVARYTRVNEGGFQPDNQHSISPGPEEWISLDVSYARGWGGHRIEGGIGADHRDRAWNDTDATLLRAWLSWTIPFR